MSSAPDLLQLIHRVLGAGKEFEIAQQLVEFLAANSETTYVNLQLVRQLTPGANAGEYDQAIVKALKVLSGDAIRILDVCFEIFDDEDHPHKLTSIEARDALEHQVNPLTGEKDPDIRRRVALYFSPTPEAMRLLDSHQHGA